MFDASASNTIKLQVKNTFDQDVQLMSSDKEPSQGVQVRIGMLTLNLLRISSCNLQEGSASKALTIYCVSSSPPTDCSLSAARTQKLIPPTLCQDPWVMS